MSRKKPGQDVCGRPSARLILLAFLFLSNLCLLYGGGGPKESARNPVGASSLKVNVNLVLVNATVTGHHGFVTSLEKGDFKIFEDKVEQTICQFSNQDLPASIGLVVDVSGSMTDKMAQAREALTTFLKTSNQKDEYFLLTFANRPVMAIDFTPDIASIQNRLVFKRAGGATTLYDATYLALNKIKQGHNPKKAILLITDGEDTASRYSLADLRDALKESECQLFVIGILGPSLQEDNLGTNVSDVLTEMAETTGGSAFFPTWAEDLPAICEQIALEIKSEYILGYTPTNLARDGCWRKIKVKMHSPNTNLYLSVHAKRGYYAPSH